MTRVLCDSLTFASNHDKQSAACGDKLFLRDEESNELAVEEVMKWWQFLLIIAAACGVSASLTHICDKENMTVVAGVDTSARDALKDKHLVGKIGRISCESGDRSRACSFTILGTRKIFVFYQNLAQKKKFPLLDLIEPGDEVLVEYKDDGHIYTENPIQYFDITDFTRQRIFGIPLSNDVSVSMTSTFNVPPVTAVIYGPIADPASDVSPIAGQEHLLDPSSSTAYKHIPGSLGYLKPSSMDPDPPTPQPMPLSLFLK